MRFSISEVAREFGISTSRIRWYEKQDVIPPIKRDESGRRYYDESDLDWFSVVMCMKDTGMPIEKIQKFAHLTSLGDSTLQERLEMVKEQREVTLNSIKKLQECMDTIDFKIMYYTECIKDGTEVNMKKKYYANHIHQRLDKKPNLI